jgi:hypothetical protein
MRGKIGLLAIVVIVCGLISLFGCADKGKQSEKKEKATIVTSTKEWKTYVSKYGFSVSYPADWYLQEYKDPKGRMEGYWPFAIYDYNPDKPEDYPESKGIGVEFLFYDDAVSDLASKGLQIPENAYEKILFLSERHNIYKINSKDIIKKIDINGIKLCLIYFDGIRLREALYYLPKNDALVEVIRYSDYGENDFMAVLRTIKIIDEK